MYLGVCFECFKVKVIIAITGSVIVHVVRNASGTAEEFGLFLGLDTFSAGEDASRGDIDTLSDERAVVGAAVER